MKKSEIIKRLAAIEKHLGIHKEEPVDKFAELREAHRNGAVIQIRNISYGYWSDIESPVWTADREYRIKPEEKPKVGDVCKFWDDNENYFAIGIYYCTSSDFPLFPHRLRLGVNVYRDFTHAKPLTNQEAIDLLFK